MSIFDKMDEADRAFESGKAKLKKPSKAKPNGEGGPETVAEARSASTPDDDLTPITICLADVAPEPVRWLWPGRIALGKVSIIAGDPGLGKSLITLAMSAVVSTGGRWPDGTRAPAGEVILLTAEDDLADTIRPRLDAAGADVRRVHALTMIREVDQATGEINHRAFSIKRDLARLDKLLADHPDCMLIVIDPISSYLDGTDSHNNAEVRGVLTPLAALAARHQAAVVSVSHLNKGMNTSVMYRTMGSLAFVAQARAAYAVVKDKDDSRRRLMLPVKNNLAEDSSGLAYTLATAKNGAVVVAWESEPVTISADEALAPAPREEDGEKNEREDAAQWLREVLESGPVKAKDVQRLAKDAGHAWITVRRARDSANVRIYREGFGPKSVSWWIILAHIPAHTRAGEQVCENPSDASNSGNDSAIDAHHEQVYRGESKYGEQVCDPSGDDSGPEEAL